MQKELQIISRIRNRGTLTIGCSNQQFKVMENKSLQEMYSFAFQPHYPKKYRLGEPNANKRHQEKPLDFRKMHQVSVILDPWAKHKTQQGQSDNTDNKLRHVVITEELLQDRRANQEKGQE